MFMGVAYSTSLVPRPTFSQLRMDYITAMLRSLDCGAEGAQYGAEGALVHDRKIAKICRSETGVF